MRKAVAAMFASLALAALMAGTAAADTLPPCNDANGDGMASGREYAQHHVRANAREGMIGAGGHIPGTHSGFSLCLGVH